MEWDKLWALNKQAIEPVAHRITAVDVENICLLILDNGPELPEVVEHPLHPKDNSLGVKPVNFFKSVVLDYIDAVDIKPGEKITLMKWGNAVVDAIEEAENVTVAGHPVKLVLKGNLTLEDRDFKKTKKLTWLSAFEEHLVPVKLTKFGYLMTKDKIEEEDQIEDLINTDSRTDIPALTEPYFLRYEKSDII
jgi:glutamyl-tRNA synthetase